MSLANHQEMGTHNTYDTKSIITNSKHTRGLLKGITAKARL